MDKMYSNDKNVQILITVLKAYNIRKVVASPGTTNFPFVYSIQQDDFFDVYSCVDERSAAYMACGLSLESGEAIVITCTGATASRNYLPALTEAFYRKLPIIVVAGTDGNHNIGHLSPQIMDRSISPKDAVRFSVSISNINSQIDEWGNNLKINSAISEAFRHGGGPVLITLQYSEAPFECSVIPSYRVIKRVTYDDLSWPDLENKRIAVFIGAHKKFKDDEIAIIDRFCEVNNAYVFCDHTSAYNGKYRINYSLAASQIYYDPIALQPDILIHIGEISGEYYMLRKMRPQSVWRVNEDGEMRDKFRRLTYVFEMTEKTFFSHYILSSHKNISNYNALCKECVELEDKITEIPFSNIWIAKKIHALMPKNSTIHFGILNSLRSWNFFEIDSSITTSCNVGGFGIDGAVSTLIGASLCNSDKLFFVILGDLAFFYDLNSICNRHVSKNVRIMIINNGHGTEFSNYDHPASRLGLKVDDYVAAGGHNGCQSPDLLKSYSENLGFKYISASNKDEFEQVYEQFISKKQADKPILFEIFTEPDSESEALRILHQTEVSNTKVLKTKVRSTMHSIKHTIKKFYK